MPGPFWPITTPWRPLTRANPSAMWAAPCSWTTGTNSIPAGSKMSMASMKALPMMPKMVSTPWATIVLHERLTRCHASHDPAPSLVTRSPAERGGLEAVTLQVLHRLTIPTLRT